MLRQVWAVIFFLTVGIWPVSNADELADGIVGWVVSKGGYFSSKLEIRGMAPNDPASPLGVFAKQDIDAHEKLLFVPRSLYIALSNPLPIDNSDDAWYYYTNYCELSKKLKTEMEKGDTSDYAPYIRYLNKQKPGQLPAAWSQAGKDLLRKVLPPNHDGVDWINQRFRNICIGDDDPLEEHAVALTVQRGFDNALIPIWDMVNHKNGHVNVENDSIWHKDGFHLRSKRAIKAGEELFATYDKCLDCGNIWWYWGTPEILRDFGFVEDYTQRWVFYEEGIWFEMEHDKDGELAIIWDMDQEFEDEPPQIYDLDDDDEAEPYGVADKAGMAFLKSEVERLQGLEAELKEHTAGVPKHEMETILQYHRAASLAMAMAFESATNNSNDENSQEL